MKKLSVPLFAILVSFLIVTGEANAASVEEIHIRATNVSDYNQLHEYSKDYYRSGRFSRGYAGTSIYTSRRGGSGTKQSTSCGWYGCSYKYSGMSFEYDTDEINNITLNIGIYHKISTSVLYRGTQELSLNGDYYK